MTKTPNPQTFNSLLAGMTEAAENLELDLTDLMRLLADCDGMTDVQDREVKHLKAQITLTAQALNDFWNTTRIVTH